MITAGIDTGSRTAKAVIMSDGQMVSSALCDGILQSREIASIVLEKAFRGTALTLKDIRYVVTTGYGRFVVPFAHEVISEVSCHARGVHWYFPTVRTILDIGGQDSKAINCNERGRITNFMLNDKCAGGTGRFLEVIAEIVGMSLEEMGELHFQATEKISISTICVIFAKSEILNMLREGVKKSDIVAALHDSIAALAHSLLKRISLQKDLAITGGVAKNPGVVAKIREKTGLDPLVPPDPQIIGAMGAALFAYERLRGKG
jgi:predicted CoA-substrate-specific enzyme activase